ncbi:MAG TPA: DUF4173 domain-containing protein [Acidimicrobiales bacterium]|nr:DUF4173 domain-containing protein [Acidimicrobiales bacterium]
MNTIHSTARPLGLGVTRPADVRVLVAAGVAAVLTDLAVRSGVAGLAGSLLVLAVVAGVLASRRVAGVEAACVVAAALPFGVFLSVRVSPWLLPLDIVAIAGLLLLGASLSGGGRLFDLPVPTLAVRALHAAAHGLAAPAYLAAPLGRRRPVAVLAGAGLALPLLVVLGLLLASADAVFAGFFTWWASPEDVITHAVLLGAGMWGMAGLLRLSSAEPAPAPPELPYRLGHVEATVVVGSLVALFSAFAVAQVIAVAGGASRVLETAGLTYAEYARQGFFQLLAVAAITLVALVGLRAVTDLSNPAHRLRFTVLGEVAIALTLVILAVALRRLGLYTQAYGLTMLRLFSLVFALWIATVLVLAGAALAGVAAGRAWFAGAALVAGLALLLGLNVVNPEAVVARHNVERAARQLPVDPVYLAELSDDAVPALVAALPRLQAPERTAVLEAICAGDEWPFDGWAAANTSRRRATDARQRVCGPVGVRR